MSPYSGQGLILPLMTKSSTEMGDVFGREQVALLTAREAAAVDEQAREAGGVPERVLMENAGRSTALIVQRLYPHGRVVAAVGSGNNGGDALVALRILASWGRDVGYVQTGSRPPDLALAHGYEIASLSEEECALADASVVLDGILGTGSTGAPRGSALDWIRRLNESRRPVVSLDIPSGVDPTTGQVPGEAVNAAVSVGFGWPKRGCLFQPGRAHSGRVLAVEIGFPPLWDQQAATTALITPDWAAARLPARPAAAHKGTFGRLLILAGSRGMGGAAGIAGRSAVRAGAGLVRLVSSEANRAILQSLVPEAVFTAREESAALDAVAVEATSLVAGPGLGVDDDAQDALRRTLAATVGRPTLLDADALNLLAEASGTLERLASERPLLLTPHPGELSRLTGSDVATIMGSPDAAARELADRVGCVVLLKGAPSVVAAPGEPVLVDTAGSSDLASAGMGDQLAGAIGAFLAAGAVPRVAAALGLFYGARAATLAGRGRSLSPLDVADHLDPAFADPGPAESSLGLPFVIFDQPPRW